MDSDSTLISRSAPRVVTKVRSADGSTSTRQVAVSRAVIAGAESATSSAASEARTRSPLGPVPWAPACTQAAPKRAAATRTLTEPPAYRVLDPAITFWPRRGSDGTSTTTSTSAWPVWMTRLTRGALP